MFVSVWSSMNQDEKLLIDESFTLLYFTQNCAMIYFLICLEPLGSVVMHLEHGRELCVRAYWEYLLQIYTQQIIQLETWLTRA